MPHCSSSSVITSSFAVMLACYMTEISDRIHALLAIALRIQTLDSAALWGQEVAAASHCLAKVKLVFAGTEESWSEGCERLQF